MLKNIGINKYSLKKILILVVAVTIVLIPLSSCRDVNSADTDRQINTNESANERQETGNPLPDSVTAELSDIDDMQVSRHAELGITAEIVKDENSGEVLLHVTHVNPISAAGVAGILAGDLILTVNGETIPLNPMAIGMETYLSPNPEFGNDLTFKVFRNGEELEFTAYLE
jgi:predicted metalloprotease with PDZ domain